MPKKCAICGQSKQFFGLLCMQCAHSNYEIVEDFINKSDKKICEEFHLVNLDDKPIIECHCHHDNVIPFDYYMPQEEEDKYRVVLIAVCRGCGGYREVATNILSPFAFKESAYVGLKTDSLEQEQVDYYV